jgi:hypothetical protein
MERPGIRRGVDPLFLVGVAFTVVLHGGIFFALWWTRTATAAKPPAGPGVFVDAQLVKFGRPRDLSFLPHKAGSVKKVGPPRGGRWPRT